MTKIINFQSYKQQHMSPQELRYHEHEKELQQLCAKQRVLAYIPVLLAFLGPWLWIILRGLHVFE